MITHVAISHNGIIYSLPKPNRHHHVIAMMINEFGIKPPCSGEQGFVNDKGIFLDRVEAGKEAIAAGQTQKLQWTENLLFSEDLW